MLIQVDFYRETGKWYSGGQVEIAKNAWEDGILSEVINKQQILTGCEGYYIVLDDILESKNDPNYRTTYARLYTPLDVKRALNG